MTSVVNAWPSSKNQKNQNIRKPVVAGAFYPGDRDELSDMVDTYLKAADSKEKHPDKLIGLIAPHAGYIYSGSVAGYAYKRVIGRTYSTVIIIGPSHSEYFEGAALDDKDAWETPLGIVDVDTKFVKLLEKQDQVFKVYPRAFDREHSLEVQVPFLQRTLKNSKEFKIVPISIGKYTPNVCKRIADALYVLTKDKKDVLIVISSDLSHYHAYSTAKQLDGALISDITTGCEGEDFISNIQKDSYEACGAGGIGVLMFLTQLYGGHLKEIYYANSGDTAGDKSKVVGYASIAAYKNGKKQSVLPGKDTKNSDEFFLAPKEQKEALRMARETIETYLSDKKTKTFNPKAEIFSEPCGAFVTLHKNGQLRGCIGNLIGYNNPLWETIRDMAIAAAVKDSRFDTVTSDELKDIEIEISVLSPLKKSSHEDIVLGKHGVIVKKGMYQGVFLPQVADETGWTKEEFLGHLCRDKAGLSWDAWKRDDVELFTFTAQVFGEKN